MEFRINLSLKLIISAFTYTNENYKYGCWIVFFLVFLLGLALQYVFNSLS